MAIVHHTAEFRGITGLLFIKLKEFLSQWNEEMAYDSNKEVTVVELYNMQRQPTNISKLGFCVKH